MSWLLTEPGMELLTQLGILTGVDFTCPTGVIGSYNHSELVLLCWFKGTIFVISALVSGQRQ